MFNTSDFDSYVTQESLVIPNSILLEKQRRVQIPLPSILRQIVSPFAYSTINATLKGTLAIGQDTPAWLTLRVIHQDNVVVGYQPTIFNREKFTINANAVWQMTETEELSIGIECISSEDAVLLDATIEILCVDIPKPQEQMYDDIAVVRSGAVTRSGTASMPTTIVCAPVIIFEGSDYISLEPGSAPGRVKIVLVNGE